MNDIEILIDNFEQLKKNKFIIESIDPEFFFKFGENLIKENTELRIQISARETVVDELEKENKELKEKREEYEKQLDLDYVEENYIPKSKIEKALDKINERYMTPEAISNSNGATFNYWTGKRDMCIELLEEGE